MSHLANHGSGSTDGSTGPGSSKRGPWWVRILQTSGGVAAKTGNFIENMIVTAAGVVPSGAIDPQVIQYLKVPLTAAQIKALHATPVALVAAPGAGLVVNLFDAVLSVTFGATQYAAGSAIQVLQNSIVIASTTAALLNAVAATNANLQLAFPGLGTSQTNGAANGGLSLTAASSEFTTGDSTADLHLWYSVVSL